MYRIAERSLYNGKIVIYYIWGGLGFNRLRKRRKATMKLIKQEFLTGERALFMAKDMEIHDTVFADGESPLKESKNIKLYRAEIQQEPR